MSTLAGLALCFLLQASGAEAQPDLQALFEEKCAAAAFAAVDELFRARPYEVIYLVDGYLESWLEQDELPVAERSVDPDRLLRLARIAAERADRVFSSDAFGRTVKAWSGWSAEERAAFRKGRDAHQRGREAQQEKRYEDAQEAYAAALEAAEPLGDLKGIAQAEQALGDLAVGAGHLEEAVQRHGRARDLFAALRHHGMLRSCRALGRVHEQLGDLAAARSNLERMLEAAREAGHDTDTRAVRATLARLCRELGDEEAAERYEGEEAKAEDGK